MTLDEPSISRIHNVSSMSRACTFEISITISVRIGPFVADLGRYSISNSLNSMTHFRGRPKASGLWSNGFDRIASEDDYIVDMEVWT